MAMSEDLNPSVEMFLHTFLKMESLHLMPMEYFGWVEKVLDMKAAGYLSASQMMNAALTGNAAAQHLLRATVHPAIRLEQYRNPPKLRWA